MMLECNLELSVKYFCFVNTCKSTSKSVFDTSICSVGQGPQANHLLLLVLLSLLSVGWSEPVNVYFLSHDTPVWHIPYLAILCI